MAEGVDVPGPPARSAAESQQERLVRMEKQLVESAKVGQQLLERNSELEENVRRLNETLAYERNINSDSNQNVDSGQPEESWQAEDLRVKLKNAELKAAEYARLKGLAEENVAELEANMAAKIQAFREQEKLLRAQIEELTEEIRYRDESESKAAAKEARQEAKRLSNKPVVPELDLSMHGLTSAPCAASSIREPTEESGKVMHMQEEIDTLTSEYIKATDKIAQMDGLLKAAREEREYLLRVLEDKSHNIEELTEEVLELHALISRDQLTRRSRAGSFSFGDSFLGVGRVADADAELIMSFAEEMDQGRSDTETMMRHAASAGYSDAGDVARYRTQAVSSSFTQNVVNVISRTFSMVTSDSKVPAPAAENAVEMPQSRRPLTPRAGEPLLDVPEPSRAPEQLEMGGSGGSLRTRSRSPSPQRPRTRHHTEAFSTRSPPLPLRPAEPLRKPCRMNFYCCQVYIACGKEKPRQLSARLAALRARREARRAAMQTAGADMHRHPLSKPSSRPAFRHQLTAPDLEAWTAANLESVQGNSSDMPPRTPRSHESPESPNSLRSPRSPKSDPAQPGLSPRLRAPSRTFGLRKTPAVSSVGSVEMASMPASQESGEGCGGAGPPPSPRAEGARGAETEATTSTEAQA